jgi:hypothetical protein
LAKAIKNAIASIIRRCRSGAGANLSADCSWSEIPADQLRPNCDHRVFPHACDASRPLTPSGHRVPEVVEEQAVRRLGCPERDRMSMLLGRLDVEQLGPLRESPSAFLARMHGVLGEGVHPPWTAVRERRHRSMIASSVGEANDLRPPFPRNRRPSVSFASQARYFS